VPSTTDGNAKANSASAGLSSTGTIAIIIVASIIGVLVLVALYYYFVATVEKSPLSTHSGPNSPQGKVVDLEYDSGISVLTEKGQWTANPMSQRNVMAK